MEIEGERVSSSQNELPCCRGGTRKGTRANKKGEERSKFGNLE